MLYCTLSKNHLLKGKKIMKRKHFIAVAAIICACSVLAGCSQQAASSSGAASGDSTASSVSDSAAENSSDNNSTEESTDNMATNEGTFIANSENVKQTGRTWLDENNTLWMAFSGSGAEYSFTGKKCVVTIVGDNTAAQASQVDNHARIAIYVNGERVIDDMINEPEKQYTVIDSDTETTADIKVIKLSETAMSVCGLKPIEADGTITPAAAKAHKIEIIGDSITCGYGVDDEDRDHHFSTRTEDVTKSYSYKTAQSLDADYSMVSISGYGVITGYSSDGETKQPTQTIPQYYDSLGFSYGTFGSENQYKAADIEWDHSKFVPDAIVINLGTNDESWCKGNRERCLEYKDAYKEFVKKVRAANPDAHIFCTLGIMGDSMFNFISKAIEEYKEETGDTNVSTMKFAVQSEADGYAADWHPTEATHNKATEKLTAEIKSVMGW